jgi:hypothetical protein
VQVIIPVELHESIAGLLAEFRVRVSEVVLLLVEVGGEAEISGEVDHTGVGGAGPRYGPVKQACQL